MSAYACSLSIVRALSFALAGLLGCGSSHPAASPSSLPTPPAEKAATPSEAATVAPPAAKKRARTSAKAPPPRDGTKPKKGRPLNPKDPDGRTVFVRDDDHCFVEVPPRGSSEIVDCPEAADDPAFDHCSAQIVLEEATDRCYCVDGSATPRPMPNPTPCPRAKP